MRRVLVALVVAVVCVACGGGSKTAAGGSSSDATLKIRDQAAQLKAKSASDFGAANDGQGLGVGDTVRTNGTGFAQVDYRDGSLTRLDANAQYTLTDLSSSAQAQRVVGHLDGGRAWSNVEKISSSEGRYEIDTDVATASVRGTQFNVDCTAADKSCTFTVADGTVAVTPTGGQPIDLHAGDALIVHVDGTTTAEPADLSEPWIAKNLVIDTDETNAGPVTTTSSTSTTSGGSALLDPCTLSGAEVQAVVGVTVSDGVADGDFICLYSIPGQPPYEVVDVHVTAAQSSDLESQKAGESGPVEDVAGLGDAAYVADYYPSAALYCLKDGTLFEVAVNTPVSADGQSNLYDRATLKSQAIQLMQALLNR